MTPAEFHLSRLISCPTPWDHRSQLCVKRLLDLVVSLPTCVLLSPVLIFIALLIKMDSPGPVLFVQERRGLHFNPFKMLKFRTLRHNQPDPHERYEMQSRDPRITRIGAFLRKTSLDELPQFFNVLWGTMSLVGPRPLQEWESQASLEWHAERFLMRPGITGLCQVYGRNASEFAARLDKDVEYVHQWNLLLDLHLLLKTPGCVLRREAIYPRQTPTTFHERD